MRNRRAPMALLKNVALFIAVGLLCIGAKQGTSRILCRVFEVEYRGISARAKVGRLGFVKRMPPAERAAFLESLQNSSDDPVVKEAIPLMAHNATWVEQRDELKKILLKQTPGLEEEKLRLKADAYLDVIGNLFFRTRNPYLVGETWRSIWRSLSATTPTDMCQYYLQNGVASIDLYASQPQYRKKTQGLWACSPEAQARIAAYEANPWLRVWQWAPHGLVLLAGSAAALLALLRKSGDALIPLFALALAVTGLVATGLQFILVDYHPRFTAIIDLVAYLTLALALAHWCDARGGRKLAAAPAEGSAN